MSASVFSSITVGMVRVAAVGDEGSLPKRFSYLVGTIGTLQEVWCRFFPLQTADLRAARRSAPRRGQDCQRAAGGAVAPSRLRGVPFFMKQVTGKTPIPADLMVRQFQNTQGGPLIGSVHSLDSHRRSLSLSQRCASASQIQSVNRRFRSGKSGSPLPAEAQASATRTRNQGEKFLWLRQSVSGNHAPPCSFIWCRLGIAHGQVGPVQTLRKECLELARTALSERSKATLLQMAHVWNRLADEHDRRADGDEAH